MKKLTLIAALLLFVISACSDLTSPNLDGSTSTSSTTAQKNTSGQTTGSQSITLSNGKWVTAYLASWNHYAPPGGNWGNLPTDAIDWSAFSQMNYFALKPISGGTLSPIAAGQNFNPDRLKAIVSAAHQNMKPILFTVGGWGTHSGFSSNITAANRNIFISNIISVLKQWKFDGVDLDMEPINNSDVDNYVAFVKQLKAAIDTLNTPILSKPMLCTATHWQPKMFSQIQNEFDEINLMTYDYSGAWPGWVTWHNSPVYSGGNTFPNSTTPLPSTDNTVNQFTNAGVSVSKLGIGIDFYGYVWNGVTKPQESWVTAPTVTDNVPYYKIMTDYYPNATKHWDSSAQAAYLTIDGLLNGVQTKDFISYDDQQSIQSKFNYIYQKGLGGAIIWELGGGYRASQPSGKRDVLLQTVKNAWQNTTTTTGGTTSNPSISISSPQNGATVSGTVSLYADLQNATGYTAKYTINGKNLCSTLTSNPFTYQWNTTSVSDGTYTIGIIAQDANGVIVQNSIQVTVANGTSSSTSGSSNGTLIYGDALQNPWINTSWSATVDFANTINVKDGTSAIKISQQAWGALSLHNGSWSNPVNLNASGSQNLTFAVYTSVNDLKIGVTFQNDNKASFPTVTYGSSIPANTWTLVSIPISKLNPNNLDVNRINIQDQRGRSVVYYIDDLQIGDPTSSGSGGSTSSGSTSGSSTSPELNIYSDQLSTPWINSSWSATIDFANTSVVKSGSDAVKVDENAWGAFSVHHGNWGSNQPISTSSYNSLTFDVYTGSKSVDIGASFQNDAGSTFPKIDYGTLPANQWVTISIPINKLNPSAISVDRITIQDMSGQANVFYLDNIHLQ